ncbi:MAG: 30S ribosomal protein S19e [Nanoarchaeota archaeon]
MKIKDKNPNELIEKASKELQSVIKAPEWTLFTKTGTGKDRVPARTDWYHIRSAAVLRKIYIDGPIGVSKLRNKFGTRKNRGTKPEQFKQAGGKIIRTILQQLEKANFITKAEKGVHKGRIITTKGKSFLDKIK